MVHKHQPEKMDPRRAAVYAPLVLAQMPRLLGCLDREQHSISYGSFDRTHWGWKFCDFPVMMAQIAAYPLALLWRYPFPGNSYHQNQQVLAWIHGAVEYVCRQQHRNGSFDSVGPFTQDHGNSLFMTYLMTEVQRLLGTALAPDLERAIPRATIAACDFALRSDEDYAFISNHQALYAVAFHNAAQLTGEERFERRARLNIERIIRKQSSEGWYEEYGGADPGYESLGIFYLATYWRRTRDPQVLESLRRSVEFLSHFVHPDGSVGGVYGSRHTSVYMPGGFELLAAEIPAAAAVARFLQKRLSRGNVLTPATCDPQNLGVLAYTYLEGCFAPPQETAAAALPCESLDGVRRFPQSGLTLVGTRCYYAVVNTSKGGVCRIFDKQRERVAYEDAGYVARAAGRRYTSQLSGLSHAVDSGAPDEVASEGQFGEVRQELPTASKWMLLRLLNLTLFRSLTLGAWVRRQILARLILAKRPGPLRLRRIIRFANSEIRFRDDLTLAGRARVDAVDLARSFTPIHMGSAKYFHFSELESTPLLPVEDAAVRLNHNGAVTCEFDIHFPALTQDGAVRLEVSTLS
jgi:hypothetical protein